MYIPLLSVGVDYITCDVQYGEAGLSGEGGPGGPGGGGMHFQFQVSRVQDSGARGRPLKVWKNFVRDVEVWE